MEDVKINTKHEQGILEATDARCAGRSTSLKMLLMIICYEIKPIKIKPEQPTFNKR
jgi:hypothetical protein